MAQPQGRRGGEWVWMLVVVVLLVLILLVGIGAVTTAETCRNRIASDPGYANARFYGAGIGLCLAG
jgi:hypothetical protein